MMFEIAGGIILASVIGAIVIWVTRGLWFIVPKQAAIPTNETPEQRVLAGEEARLRAADEMERLLPPIKPYVAPVAPSSGKPADLRSDWQKRKELQQ